MWWLKLIGAYLFGTALSQYAALLQRLRGGAPTPSAFQPPTVAAGTPIPVLYGTAPVPPIVTWLGDVKTREIYQYISAVIHFAPPQRITIAYAYQVWLQGVLCWGKTSAPINILFGDRVLLSNQAPTQRLILQGPTGDEWADVATADTDFFAIESLHGGRMTANYALPYVWGQLGHGGGFIGPVTFAIGSRQYGPDPVLQAKMNPGGVDDPVNNVPDYGDLATVVYNGVEVGESPTPPPVKYIIARYPDHAIPGLLTTSYATGRYVQYGPGPAWGITELNHAAMLFDAMRSSKYGGGKPEGMFDGASWSASAATLFSEGIYGSWLVGSDGRQGILRDMKDEVERVVDGQLVQHPVTGLLRFTLNRNEAATDDAYNALPAFDEHDLHNVEWHEAQPSEVINQVTIEFPSAARLWKTDTVTLTNEASVLEVGLKPTTITLQSVTDREVALKICARELRRGSTPLARGKAKGTRVFWSAERGNCFRWSNDKYGIAGLVVRITNIDYGTPESSEIALEFVEDLFGNYAITYSGPETPPIVTQASLIRPVIMQILSEVIGTPPTYGQLSLTVVDPQHRIIEIAFNKRTGDGPATDWTVVATATPNTADPTFPYNSTVTLGNLQGDWVTTVALSATGTASIAYRIRYIGTSVDDIQEILGESEAFGPARRVSAPVVGFVYSGSDVIVTVSAPDATSVKIAGSLSGAPTEADVRATTALTTRPFTKTFTAPAAGQVLTIESLAYGGAVESALSVPLSIPGIATTGSRGNISIIVRDGSGGFVPVLTSSGGTVVV
jgi:hypothetical protein